MAKGTILSIDAMGGDAAPDVPVEGAAVLLARRADITLLMHGDEALLAPLVDAQAALRGRCTIVHTDAVITSDMKPSQALRRGKGSSMWNAIEAVKNGEAGAAVSAGNTGALMAISMLILRKMEGVHRPAMTALWPTVRGRTVVLDVGANLEADAAQLVTFAIMGEAYARAALDIEKPSIGLLNIGSEEMKGHDEVREAHEWLRTATLDMDYRGFVEGDDISKGAVDVVVTDGFTGNVALKAGEGVARMLASRMREAFTANLRSKLGAALAMDGLKRLREQMDPSNVNGGVLLGLGGVSVKSHGGTDARGFAKACELAAALAESDYRDKIIANLLRVRESGLAAG
ncbi:phosphate acyltransferase PlsX [Hyphomonas johnsonii]|jgi:glycerol-3-phosphate acyltransferase PlsX|uniref:Phosphate acyltransferase n=1 Tax=Hyphomonas johnsonii MHS-2 TaxID=1280950 RepID=A0A059FTI0_9PROT|nr:phosphate acyltransferase PlsX [Hyphomonas johnsonii]KCZ93969.1 phosphate acyltransferase [Hyphomonas johnsonii MHS-2]